MIQNRDALCNHGNESVREPLVEIATHALSHVHPTTTLPRIVSRDGTTLTVDTRTYELTAIDNIYVIAAGKGAPATVQALHDILGDAITEGIVAAKHPTDISLPGIDVLEAGHPLPTSASERAGHRVQSVARQATADDLVITCINGGASALLAAPAGDITTADLATLTDMLLEAGLPIHEVNTVRKHVSTVKGGHLATQIAPADLVTLVTVDEVAGDPWGPTVPDDTTFTDAIEVLKRHNLWTTIPSRVRNHLHQGATSTDPPQETPTTAELPPATRHTVIVADATDVCEAAAASAADHGYNTMLLSTMLEGESREVGLAMAGIAKEIVQHHRPVAPPCVVVSGGETTVTVDDSAGTGGPNQEFATRVALAIDELDGVGCVALGTDGTDGPTDVAGGLVDTTTTDRAATANIDLFAKLEHHETTPALTQLGDAIRTGSTGTNVMDLRLLLVE